MITKKQMLDRARLLESEIYANEEENRFMEQELNQIYDKLDEMKASEPPPSIQLEDAKESE